MCLDNSERIWERKRERKKVKVGLGEGSIGCRKEDSSCIVVRVQQQRMGGDAFKLRI